MFPKTSVCCRHACDIQVYLNFRCFCEINLVDHSSYVTGSKTCVNFEPRSPKHAL